MHWIEKVISEQFKLLILLRLNFQPKPDDIKLLTAVWVSAFRISFYTPNEGRDRKRMIAAFAASFPTLTKWPCPAEIIKRMKSRTPVKKLIYEPPPADFKFVNKNIQLLKARMVGEITQEQLEAKIKMKP